jgi:hypothetical protein
MLLFSPFYICWWLLLKLQLWLRALPLAEALLLLLLLLLLLPLAAL